MEVLFEILFEFFGEVILQVVFEALAEVGIHITRGNRQHAESRSGWRLVVGYPLLGAMLGGLSLLVFPNSLAHVHGGRIATFLLAPVVAGLSMVALGSWRARHGQERNNLNRFIYAYLFALGMAAVRYVWAG
jgi:hypothetical protein